jgi:protoporphyrinogen oxidase
LDSDFASQRIKKLSLFEAIKDAIYIKKEEKHKTLVDEFAYPNYGAGIPYDRMAKAIVEGGGRLILNTPVQSIIPAQDKNNPQVELKNGDNFDYDHIISTMPINALVLQMQAPENVRAQAEALKFRNTILVYLLLEGVSPFPDQWIYVHSSNLKTGRITNFSNWNTLINKGRSETILCLEYWCNDGDDIWAGENDKLIELATEEIYLTTLVKEGSVKNGMVVRVPKCYPVYATGYKAHLRLIEEFLSKQKGISVIGRYGSFKYNNQDHSILMGILASENILQDAKHNLWEVNTDYSYQENSKITSTGLIYKK